MLDAADKLAKLRDLINLVLSLAQRLLNIRRNKFSA